MTREPAGRTKSKLVTPIVCILLYNILVVSMDPYSTSNADRGDGIIDPRTGDIAFPPLGDDRYTDGSLRFVNMHQISKSYSSFLMTDLPLVTTVTYQVIDIASQKELTEPERTKVLRQFLQNTKQTGPGSDWFLPFWQDDRLRLIGLIVYLAINGTLLYLIAKALFFSREKHTLPAATST